MIRVLVPTLLIFFGVIAWQVIRQTPMTIVSQTPINATLVTVEKQTLPRWWRSDREITVGVVDIELLGRTTVSLIPPYPLPGATIRLLVLEYANGEKALVHAPEGYEDSEVHYE